ncbi:ATP-binding cassette domain-containing protein [Thermococcus sp.]|uniref:ABC transporter ATP-binding protein n=2 Tax=Thermococcus sp. TaxID=35749 RepID=UPI00260E2A86|nr:ATP-binding cassette domain-containing protein [Thermococcus sp.]
MIEVKNLRVVYHSNGRSFVGLEEFNGSFERGRISVIFGPSGSGKTSLLLSVATLLRPSEGSVAYDGMDVYSLPEAEMRKLRRKLGVSFQEPTFVNVLSVWENVELALYGAGKLKAEFKRRAEELAKELGIGHTLHKRPTEISGGEARRASIVRALAHNPEVILLDEPTAYLDRESAELLLAHLEKEKERGKTIVVTTHDPIFEGIADAKFVLQYGRQLT